MPIANPSGDILDGIRLTVLILASWCQWAETFKFTPIALVDPKWGVSLD